MPLLGGIYHYLSKIPNLSKIPSEMLRQTDTPPTEDFPPYALTRDQLPTQLPF